MRFLPPGRPQVDVEVFDVTKDSKVIFPSSHVIIFQPHDGKLIGAEEYNIKKRFQAARRLFPHRGEFRIRDSR